MSSSCIIWSAIVTNERGAACAICDARVGAWSRHRGGHHCGHAFAPEWTQIAPAGSTDAPASAERGHGGRPRSAFPVEKADRQKASKEKVTS